MKWLPMSGDSGLGVHLNFPYIINYELWEKFPQELKDIFVECAKIAEDETVLITNAANAENVDIVVGHGYTKCYDVGQDEPGKVEIAYAAPPLTMLFLKQLSRPVRPTQQKLRSCTSPWCKEERRCMSQRI